MNLIRLFIKQPVTVGVGVILILLAGLISLKRIPIQLTPNVEDTIVTVSTFWEGASPEEVELEIIDKQEERLIGIPSLREITSSANQSSGSIRLEFAQGTLKSEALREVNIKLREVSDYPENVDEPVISASDRQHRDYIAWIMFFTSDPDFDVRTLRDFALDRIEPILERVQGVSEINVLGGREREAQIQFDPIRLAQYKITPRDFVQKIRESNRNVSAGALQDGKLNVRLRTMGQFKSLKQVEETIIAHSEGGPIYIRDVADVVMSFKEASGFVRAKGVPVIAMNAQREVGSNVIEVMKGLKAAINQLNAPGGALDEKARELGLQGKLYLNQSYDQTGYIEDALVLVRNNIWIGGILATLVLILFLRSLRSVGIIAMAIPISVIGAVVVMVSMGRSINVISLAGMAFAVGMVVDNAIVVLENIFRHREMGKSRRQAASDGATEVWG
ncbi:MAG: efflux RND transporter permease subunit, partial [Planctomycetota bacterium]|nr:efflux RND transporter permease subunit [Planctomycetota bacterium]